MLATLAAKVDVELPADAGPDSFDFLPVLLDRQPANQPVRESLVMRSGAGLFTIRSGEWKLIDGLGSGGFSRPSRIKPGPGDPRGQLYNLAQDRGEAKNLYEQEPKIVARLLARLTKIRNAGRSRPLSE